MRRITALIAFALSAAVAPVRVAAAEPCPPGSQCENQRTQEFIQKNLSGRYRLCREVYPDDDVAALVQKRKPLDPKTAAPCQDGLAIDDLKFYVPAIDPDSKSTFLREYSKAVEAMKAELAFSDQMRAERSAATLMFAKTVASNFEDRWAPTGYAVRQPVAAAQSIPVSADPPTKLEGRTPQAVRRGTRSEIVKEYQAALNAVMHSNLAEDGDYGRLSGQAVFAFQRWYNRKLRKAQVTAPGENSLEETGQLDEETAKTLVSEFQISKKLYPSGLIDEPTEAALKREAATARPKGPRHYQGDSADFVGDPGEEIKSRGRITVFYPSRALTKEERRMEGSNFRNQFGPVDRFGQNICTAEEYLDRKPGCDYVSGGMDQRLQMADGTPVRSLELERLIRENMPQYRSRIDEAGLPIRITTTGGCRAFDGANHIDLAVGSRLSETDSVASVVNRHEGDFDFIFPNGYERDPWVKNGCGRGGSSPHRRRRRR